MTKPTDVALAELAAVSPIDGRYRRGTKQLSGFFSEFGLIRYRIQIEIEYFLALMEVLPAGKDLPAGIAEKLRAIPENLTLEQAEKVKATEKVTNHDVKAFEYFIKEQFDALGLQPFKEFVHFALTSQDINNTSTPLMIKNSLEACFLPALDEVIATLTAKLPEWNMSMLARTHGQPASPTNLGQGDQGVHRAPRGAAGPPPPGAAQLQVRRRHRQHERAPCHLPYVINIHTIIIHSICTYIYIYIERERELSSISHTST